MVVRVFFLIYPLGDLILVSILDVAVQMADVATLGRPPTTFRASAGEVLVPRRGRWQALQDEESSKAKRTLKASLKNGWVGARALQIWKIHLKGAVRVLAFGGSRKTGLRREKSMWLI